MKRHTYIPCTLFLCFIALSIIGCIPSSNPSTTTQATPNTESLKNKAHQFAQNELARYNAIELIYKNIPELHTTRVPINNSLIQGWTKTYRRFTHYEVVDIVRSESLLAPIHYEITFNYEQYNTPYRKTDQANAEQQCADDFHYELRYTESLSRTFDCDTQGDPLETAPAPPERPLYFKKDYLRETATRPSLP